MNRFDVVIPTFNNVSELRECLDSLETQSLASFRAVVCVDGSTDRTDEYLASIRGRMSIAVLWHPGHANRGRSATRNLALPLLDSQYTLFLDSDLALHEHGLSKHEEVLSAHPSASVGGIRYANADTNVWARYKSARRLSRWPAGSLLPASQFITANVALHTSDLLALGGFDEQMSNYGGEDTDLGFRLATTLKRPIVSNPDAFAVASERKSLDAALLDLRTYGRTNLHYLRAKHPQLIDPFQTHRYGSSRLSDRAFIALMNPVTDAVVDGLLGRVPFEVQEQLINYKVIRAVFQGYAEGFRAVGSAANDEQPTRGG
jgi:glycosyltransferase involved in cell wall biosynthesis